MANYADKGCAALLLWLPGAVAAIRDETLTEDAERKLRLFADDHASRNAMPPSAAERAQWIKLSIRHARKAPLLCCLPLHSYWPFRQSGCTKWRQAEYNRVWDMVAPSFQGYIDEALAEAALAAAEARPRETGQAAAPVSDSVRRS